MITRPTNMTLGDWADQVVLDLDRYGSYGRLDDFTSWQDWGVQFLNSTSIGRNLPNPYGFKVWSDWAERLCGVMP